MSNATLDPEILALFPVPATTVERSLHDEIYLIFSKQPKLTIGDLEVAMIETKVTTLSGTTPLGLVARKLEEFVKSGMVGRPKLAPIDKYMLQRKPFMEPNHLPGLRELLTVAKASETTPEAIETWTKERDLPHGLSGAPWTDETCRILVELVKNPPAVDEPQVAAEVEPLPSEAEQEATVQEALAEDPHTAAMKQLDEFFIALSAESPESAQAVAVVRDAMTGTRATAAQLTSAIMKAGVEAGERWSLEVGQRISKALTEITGTAAPEVERAPITASDGYELDAFAQTRHEAKQKEEVPPPTPEPTIEQALPPEERPSDEPAGFEPAEQAAQEQLPEPQQPTDGGEPPQEAEQGKNVGTTLQVVATHHRSQPFYWDGSEWVIVEQQGDDFKVKCTKKLLSSKRGAGTVAVLTPGTIVSLTKPEKASKKKGEEAKAAPVPESNAAVEAAIGLKPGTLQETPIAERPYNVTIPDEDPEENPVIRKFLELQDEREYHRHMASEATKAIAALVKDHPEVQEYMQAQLEAAQNFMDLFHNVGYLNNPAPIHQIYPSN